VTFDEGGYNPDYIKNQNPAMNPGFVESTSTAATVASSSATSDAGAHSAGYPSHSEFYSPKPDQPSEAEEIARKKPRKRRRKRVQEWVQQWAELLPWRALPVFAWSDRL